MASCFQKAHEPSQFEATGLCPCRQVYSSSLLAFTVRLNGRFSSLIFGIANIIQNTVQSSSAYPSGWCGYLVWMTQVH